MKTWIKIVIAVVGSGAIGGLTFAASIYPIWGSVFSYLTLAISGTMSIIIGWPPQKVGE
jgi:hypothetical protein